MTDKMTLIDVRDRLRGADHNGMAADTCDELADALDAHIAAMGEPVAFVAGDDVERHMDWNPKIPVFPIPVGTPLYRAASPASGDWDKVRDVIDELRIYDIPATRAVIKKLTAALPESQP